MEDLQKLKSLEAEIFSESELYYNAHKVISLIKDVIKLDEHKYALELILKYESILEENFNEAPKLAELLFDYDKEKATKWLLRSLDIARYPQNYFDIARIAAQKTLDFNLTVKFLNEGFEAIFEKHREGDYDFLSNGGLHSPDEWAVRQLEKHVWVGPKINPENGTIIEWNYNPEVLKIDQIHWASLWNHIKPVMKAVYEHWEDELWGPSDYNEVLLENLEDDFSEETEWIDRIKNKLREGQNLLNDDEGDTDFMGWYSVFDSKSGETYACTIEGFDENGLVWDCELDQLI